MMHYGLFSTPFERSDERESRHQAKGMRNSA